MRSSVFIVSSCILGTNEVEFWNSLFERYHDKYKFHFFTTSLNDQLAADEIIQVVYGANVFDDKPQECTEKLQELINSVAQNDHIWEEFDSNHSYILAYSWLQFWTIATRLFRPAKAIIWNGHHIPEAALAEVCRIEGIESLFAERGPFAGTFVLDSEGINCNSKFYKNAPEMSLRAAHPNLKIFGDFYFSNGVSNWGQPNRMSRSEFFSTFELPDNKQILFFPTQVDRDTNSKLFSPHFKGTEDALNSLIEWCNANHEEVFLIIKKHPMHEGDHFFEGLKIESGSFIEDVHIFDCIEYCDGIVSVNSSAAVEGALKGKPVLLLGDSLLDHCPQVFKLHERKNFNETLRSFVDFCGNKISIQNDDFFEKLLFGYLYSANKEYLSLGVKAPELSCSLEAATPLPEPEVFQHSVSSLGHLVPNFRSILFQAIKDRKKPDITIEDIPPDPSNALFRALRRLGLLSGPSKK